MIQKHMLLSFPEELWAMFKEEPNKSKLVRDLLDEHYEISKIKKMTKEEKIRELQKLEEVDKLKEQIRIVENG